jgi:hypothetical protein
MSPYLLEDNGAVLWWNVMTRREIACQWRLQEMDVTIEANGEEQKVK